MTIDEAIAKLRRDAIIDKYNMQGYSMKEHEQLAEWLEDYKAIKDGSIPIIHGKAELELHDNAIRNKAIDDFAENFSLEISESIIWGMIVNYISADETSDKIVDYVADTIRKTAEQLKGGGEDV